MSDVYNCNGQTLDRALTITVKAPHDVELVIKVADIDEDDHFQVLEDLVYDLPRLTSDLLAAMVEKAEAAMAAKDD